MEVVGPATARALAEFFLLSQRDIDAALLALEAEGFVLRGRFHPDATELEWCDRRLLARIHRLTINRLRAEIQPVSLADFQRFLLAWQRVDAGHRAEGPEGVEAVLELLDANSHIVSGDDVYGGTFRLFERVRRRSAGHHFDFVDLTDPAKLVAALEPETRMVWVETPTNPLLRLARSPLLHREDRLGTFGASAKPEGSSVHAAAVKPCIPLRARKPGGLA